jgi:predicted nucleotidyltransferase component of viral defense system
MIADNLIGWRREHFNMIVTFMQYLGQYNNPQSGFVLKGGTALMLCYNLNRFSEDIDLDGYMGGIEELILKFAKWAGVKYRTAKNTPIVKRYMIEYPNKYRKEKEAKPLKIEISYRNYGQDMTSITRIAPTPNIPTGVLTYNISMMTSLKIQAFINREKLRDLNDVVFLGLNYYNQIDISTRILLQDALMRRGLEHFDYLMVNQKDPLIDSKKLESGILQLWNNLGLL